MSTALSVGGTCAALTVPAKKKPGSKGAPTAKAFKDSAKTAKKKKKS